MTKIVPIESIVSKIIFLRSEKVLLDRDLAKLYGVETKALKQAVRRNIKRFPSDFMFELSKEEFEDWRSQFVTSNSDKMGLRYKPMAFTEQGVAMLSSVLKSERAIEVNIAIMRAFVELRKISSSHKQLAQKLREIESRLEDHDESIDAIFEAIQQLLKPPEKPRKRIGFEVKEPKGRYGKRTRETQV
jgi:ORF6N domain